MRRELKIKELNNTEKLMDKAINALEYSYSKAKNINLDEGLDLDNQEVFEAFTSRYARLCDIFTQKYLKTFFLLLGENKRTIIDKANYLEKLGIASGEDLIEICDLRNEVAHEYVEEELIELYRDVLELSGKLVEIIRTTERYLADNI